MVSKGSVTRGHMFKSQPPLIYHHNHFTTDEPIIYSLCLTIIFIFVFSALFINHWVCVRVYNIFRASIISLSFLLSCFLEMALEVSVTRGHRCKSQPPLIQSGIFSTSYEKGLYCVNTSSLKGSHVRRPQPSA